MMVPPIASMLLLNTTIQNTIRNSATSKATNIGYNEYSNRASCVRANSVPHHELYCFIEPNTLCCNITNYTEETKCLINN
jgi:hypothetical protein